MTNRCGFPKNKIGDAKCALQRILDGAGGDATFGLMQFKHPCNGTCTASSSSCGSGCGAVGTGACDDGQLAVEIQTGNANLMREWVDGQCQGTCGGNNYPRELTTGQWTPIARSLARANEYLRGQTTVGFPLATGGSSIGTPLANDPQLECRPVSVILLTDGDDTCDTDPAVAAANAATLYASDLKGTTAANKAIRTYVIGFGASGGNFNPTALDNIATSGGTDSHDASGHKYFPAMNEEQLSVALNRIIADAQPPVEVCDGKDNDCDGNSDEGIPKFCNKPAGVNDKTLCMEPDESLCDGMDDDCDGVIDEGLTNACGACGAVPKEICDSRDNDCDTRIDEDTNTLEPCGKDTGECKTGQLVCIDGGDQCKGQIGPGKEVCDCKDNDCDGSSDEENPDKLCPSGQRCAGCRCVQFCERTVEFSVSCPPGLAADIQANGECLCIEDKCDAVACPKSTLTSDDNEVLCAPNNARVSPCICKAGMCLSNCAGVVCKSGEVCDSKRGGRCVDESCRGLGCASGELCDPGSGRCMKDECANAKCPSDQVCRGGQCEASCANVTCTGGQVCKGGSCQAEPCSSVSCSGAQVCEPNLGECVANKCAAVQCKSGQLCSLSTGQCESQPCWNVKCPNGQACEAGQCFKKNPTSAKEPTDPNAEASRLIATGGGGCACSVPGGGPQGGVGGDLAAGLGLALLALWRARRRVLPALRALQVLAPWVGCVALAALGGCRVSPICIDCADAASNVITDSGDSAPELDAGGAAADGGGDKGDAGMDGGKDGGDSMPMEAGVKCTPTGAESCNNKDDDCDLRVDEDVLPTENKCTQVGVCANAAPVCVNGSWTCRYSASTYESDESLCDGQDNDCNGKVDESFPTLGTSCEAGVGACKALGKLRCNNTGKGLVCDAVPLAPGEEVCNGKDDDCDGMADEPKNTPGTNPSYVKDDVVKVKNDRWMYKYEASRVDAEAAKQGIINSRTCSRAGVLPWTNVTYTEADAACKSVNMTLCELDDWIDACTGPLGTCTWSTAGSCTTYTPGTCNGHDVNTQAGQAESDVLKATGGSADCYADFGSAGRVFDLSGNAKEWTVGGNSPTANPVRGGSYNNGPEGLRCDFDFTLAAADVRLPNVGFRCCSNSEP